MTDPNDPDVGDVGALHAASRTHDDAIVRLASGLRESGHLAPGSAADDSYRDHLVGALQAAQHDYDQAVLTLSAGTLALSVTFANNIASTTPAADSGRLLAAAWLLLGGSLVSIVGSFVTSQVDIRRLIDRVDSGEQNVGADMNRWPARATRWLNIAAGTGLVFGLAALAWYALANLGR